MKLLAAGLAYFWGGRTGGSCNERLDAQHGYAGRLSHQPLPQTALSKATGAWSLAQMRTECLSQQDDKNPNRNAQNRDPIHPPNASSLNTVAAQKQSLDCVIENRFGVLQIGALKTLGKPVIDRL